MYESGKGVKDKESEEDADEVVVVGRGVTNNEW